MNLSDMAGYVTTQVGLTDTDDVAAAQLFLRNWDEQLYNSYLWKDALIGVDYTFDPVGNPDNAEGVVITPPVIDIVAAARVSAAPGTWGNSLRIHGMEDYYRVDWDWFAQQGVPFEFAEMPPAWFIFRGATGLQLVNNNIADSGVACEVIWYDDQNVKHVQVATPGSQMLPGTGVNQPPSTVPQTYVTVQQTATITGVYPAANYGGVAPTFVPANGVGITWDSITGRMWSYFNNQWN